jgi:hypothetical protein
LNQGQAMPRFFAPIIDSNTHPMVFVDGENLAIRYGHMLTNKGAHPAEHVAYEPNVFVWSTGINNICVQAGVIRKHYYTSVQGDELRRSRMEGDLISAGIEAPRVFRKDKSRGSKRVDISNLRPRDYESYQLNTSRQTTISHTKAYAHRLVVVDCG